MPVLLAVWIAFGIRTVLVTRRIGKKYGSDASLNISGYTIGCGPIPYVLGEMEEFQIVFGGFLEASGYSRLVERQPGIDRMLAWKAKHIEWGSLTETQFNNMLALAWNNGFNVRESYKDYLQKVS